MPLKCIDAYQFGVFATFWLKSNIYSAKNSFDSKATFAQKFWGNIAFHMHV